MPTTTGELLRNLREERHLTLLQVEKGTHIRLNYLKALENDDRELIPSAVQGKGFLRVLANFYGVDSELLIAPWEGRIPTPIAPIDSVPVDDSENLLDDTPREAEIASDNDESLVIDDQVDYPPEVAIPSISESPKPTPTPSEDLFIEIGEELSFRRKTTNLSLDDIERFTHIKSFYLRVLEEGRVEDLPSSVQGRGMLSNYARFLNLDSEALLLKYAEALQLRRKERLATAQPADRPLAPVRKPAPTTPSQTEMAWRRFVTPDMAIGGLLLISLLGFIIWGAARITSMGESASVATPPSISEVLGLTSTPSLTPEVEQTQPENENSTTDLPVEEGLAGQTTGIPLEIDGTITPPSPGGALEVYIVAYQRVFLRITADGEMVFNGRTVPGNAYTFSADEQIELLTGNAAALQVFFNENDLGSLGVTGEVISMIFTPEEIITPTAQPSSTSAPTSTSTPTDAGTSQPLPTITPLIP